MADLMEMGRVLYDHEWEKPDEWGRTLNQLADLTDEEIGKLVVLRACRSEMPRA
jgi:hypothetical protein